MATLPYNFDVFIPTRLGRRAGAVCVPFAASQPEPGWPFEEGESLGGGFLDEVDRLEKVYKALTRPPPKRR